MNPTNAVFRLPATISPATKFVAVGGILAAVITFSIHFFRSRAQDKDYSDPFPPEIKNYIISMLEDPKHIIALGGTNKSWRNAVNDVCRVKLKAIFGEDLEESKMAISVAADLWAPLQPKTCKLATLSPPDKSGVITSQMLAVLKAIQSGTVEELRQKIALLEDKTEFTTLRFCENRLQDSMNPLRLAVKSGDIEKVRLLIASGVPIGIGEDGVISHNDGPLAEAVLKGIPDILRLLLINGASVNIKVGSGNEYYQPTERSLILALILIGSMSAESNSVPNKKILECVALVMKALRYEKGFKAIQEDKELAIQAGYLLVNPYCHTVAQLLMTYGVDPIIKEYMLPIAVETSIATNNQKHLEYLSSQGWLDFKNFLLKIYYYSNKKSARQNSSCKYDLITLADRAYLVGQFELEKYLVDEKHVSYKTLETHRKLLLEKNISKAMATMMFEDSSDENHPIYIFTIGPSGQKCDWKRLLKIVDHYKIQIGAVALASPCDALYTAPILGMYQALLVETKVYGMHPSSNEARVYNEEKAFYRSKHALFLLQVIEDLVQREMSLGPLEGLLKSMQEEFFQNSEIIDKINSFN